MKLSQSAERLTGQPMFKLLDEIKKRERDGEEFIHFEIGDPDFSPPRQLINNATKILRERKHNRYCSSQGLLELREEIAWFHSVGNALKVTADNVVIAPGCNPLIYCILKCLCEEGDGIFYPNPGFPTYESVAKLLNLDPLKKVGSKVKIINYPSNPEGFMFSQDWLDSHFRAAKEMDMFILSDEIYSLINYSDHPSPSMLGSDPLLKNTAIISGYSKAFSMTGWRIGYMIGPEWLCEKVTLLLQTVVSCTNTFVQQSCIGLLKNIPQEVEQNIQELKERRDLIVAGLNSIPGIQCNVPEGAFYVFPSIKGTGKRSDEVCEILLRSGVATLPGTDFGNAGEGFIRLAYCAVSREKIRMGIDKIKNALSKGG